MDWSSFRLDFGLLLNKLVHPDLQHNYQDSKRICVFTQPLPLPDSHRLSLTTALWHIAVPVEAPFKRSNACIDVNQIRRLGCDLRLDNAND